MWLISLALAADTAADLTLATDRVAIGLAEDGSMGNRAAGVGLRADPDGPEGPTPVGGDWLAARAAVEGWVIEADGVADSNFAASGQTSVTLDWEAPGEGSMAWRHAAGSTDRYDVETWVAIPPGRSLVWTRLRLVPRADLGGVSVARIVNPDPDAWLNGSTMALLTADDDVVTAESSEDGRALALSAAGGEAGWCTDCTTPAELTVGTWSATNNARVGVRTTLGDVDADTPIVVDHVYAFGIGADAAASLAWEAAADPDPDADGVGGDDDCAPWDDTVAPGLPEADDGRDNNCDGIADEDLPGPGEATDSTWVPDVDAPTVGEAPAGCAAVSAPNGAWLLGLLLLRRRRA